MQFNCLINNILSFYKILKFDKKFSNFLYDKSLKYYVCVILLYRILLLILYCDYITNRTSIKKNTSICNHERISWSYVISEEKADVKEIHWERKKFKLAPFVWILESGVYISADGDSSFLVPLRKAKYSISRNFWNRAVNEISRAKRISESNRKFVRVKLLYKNDFRRENLLEKRKSNLKRSKEYFIIKIFSLSLKRERNLREWILLKLRCGT